jgi:hypothetical protein
MEEFLVAQLATGFDLEIKIWRMEGIALTWATRQVVLWSDHKTADQNGGWWGPNNLGQYLPN